MNKLLLDNEKIIKQSKNQDVTLTNMRVQYSAKEWGKKHTISILLKNISSIEVNYKSHLILILLAIISIIGAMISEMSLPIGIILGILFIIIFFITRKHFLIISSKGGTKIYLSIKGLKTDEVLAFLNQIEQTIIINPNGET